MKNYMKMEIPALGKNESFARSAVAAFALNLNPSLSELSDVKTVVSEGVTNCIVHAYKGKTPFEREQKRIVIECETDGDEEGGTIHIRIADEGCGIEDVERATQPFFTTLSGDERSGMGFTIMQTFMDEFRVESKLGEGTKIFMSKQIGEKVG